MEKLDRWILKRSIQFFYSRVIYFDINKERMYYSKKERKKSNLEKISKKEKNNHQGYPSSRGNLTRNAGRRNLSPFLACPLPSISLSLSLVPRLSRFYFRGIVGAHARNPLESAEFVQPGLRKTRRVYCTANFC